MNDSTQSHRGARLAGRTVILTGAAGNIGSHIARVLLREGARVVMTGRNEGKLEAFVDELASEGFDRDAMLAVTGDSADPDAGRTIVARTMERFGRLDVLVNNAGGAGPKQTLQDIPFSAAEARASGDGETMFEAAMNLLGGPWNMARAAVPHLSRGGSIINVSTIFSRTRYFGRIPYVVPKSGLNALSLGLARELGPEKGIRVNTVFPGPIESERIDTVFAAMDTLQAQPDGTTSAEFREPDDPSVPTTTAAWTIAIRGRTTWPTTILWLASERIRRVSPAHSFEVTNGMQVPAQSRSKLVSWPDDRLVDLRQPRRADPRRHRYRRSAGVCRAQPPRRRAGGAGVPHPGTSVRRESRSQGRQARRQMFSCSIWIRCARNRSSARSSSSTITSDGSTA